jgi:3-phosphoshikimate 1-carboxyvinyltransferase
MGAAIEMEDGCPPITIKGRLPLDPIDYTLPVPSAQVKSAILLAALSANGRTCVREPGPARDHTERMLPEFGVRVQCANGVICLDGPAELTATELTVPGDPSSAAFLMVAATLLPGSDLLLAEVGLNPTRTGIIDLLRRMGADIAVESERVVSGEPVADLRVRSSALNGIEIAGDEVVRAIDEFPVLFVAAAAAKGRTVVSGAQELRVKESDRIGVMARALARLGIDVQESPDGVTIDGGTVDGGVTLDAAGDHRIAMALAVAGCCSDNGITVKNSQEISTSFPAFVETVAGIGMNVAAAP